jgi:hypothetical protein
MSLFLPRQLTHLVQPTPGPVKIGVFLTMEDLGGVRSNVADLMAELVKLKRSDVIRWVSAINMKLGEPHTLTQERQRELAQQLLPIDLNVALEKWLREKGNRNWTLFHRRQLWLLLQMAVVACKEDTSANDENTLAKAIGLVALMANDLLRSIEPQQDAEQWKSDYNYSFVPSVIPMLDYGNRMEILARAHAFWFELPNTPAMLERFRQSKMDGFALAFEKKYGLSPEQFFLIALSLWSEYASSNASPLLLDKDPYLQPHFAKDDISRAMRILSQTPEQLAQYLFSKPRQNWAVDSSPLKANPMIEVFAGKYACPDIANLHRYLTDGIYFLLQEVYGSKDFGNLFGYLFEEYVNRLFGQFGIESEVLTRTFWPSPKFQATDDEACDGLLHDHDLAVVMEYKARKLTTREKYAGIPEATWTGIEDIVAKNTSRGKKGALQLANNIRRMLKGESVVSGRTPFCPTDKTTIIPVLVAFEDVMGLGAIRRWVDDKLRDSLTKEGVDSSRVGPLLILTINDVEVLEALTHKNQWVDVIRGYAKYIQDHPDDPIATFPVYLSTCNFKQEDPGTSFVAKGVAKALEFAVEKLPKSVPTNSP